MSVSGTLSIIVAAVAVILGFLILRDINDSGESSNGGGDTPEASTTVPGGANNTEPTSPDGSTTAPTTPAALKPYTVIVANAAKVNGAAGQMTTALQGIGVQTLPGINSNVAAAEAATTIFFNPGYDLEAQDLATKMGVATAPAAMPSPPPIESGASLGAANLLVQLGTDLAGKPLPVAGATADTTAPPST
jgi:hypothetical protein